VFIKKLHPNFTKKLTSKLLTQHHHNHSAIVRGFQQDPSKIHEECGGQEQVELGIVFGANDVLL
jgi:hypothetical protein